MKRWLDILVPGLLMAAAVLLSTRDSPLVERLRNAVFDSYQRAMPRVYEPLPVRIVAIDEASLARLGQWPWPRGLLAALVDRLREAGAATVVLDILLAEPDRMAPENIRALLRDMPQPDALRAELARLPDPDAVLAESLKRLPTVTAFALAGRGPETAPAAKAGFATAGDDPLLFVPRFTRAIPSLPTLEAAAAGNGATNYIPDADGFVRRTPLLLAFGGQLYPSLVAEALRVAQGATSYTVKASGASGEISFGEQTGITHIRIGSAIVPTDATGALPLYDTGHVAKRFIPAWALLEPDFDRRQVAGAIVLVGATAEGLRDFKPTPLDPAMAGVEIHAQAIEQILAGDFLRRPDWAKGAELVFLVVFGSLLILVIRRVGPLRALIIALAAGAAALWLSWYGFAQKRWLIDPLFPSLMALLVYLSCSLIGYLNSEREKRFVRGAMGRYLSPVLVAELTKDPARLKLGGEVRELTLLFSDLRGFTHIAESLDPAELTRLMNRFLTPLTRVIQDSGGFIDKYMGDCVMAFWNAPLDQPGHPAKAVEAALAIEAALAELNGALEAEAAEARRPAVTLAAGIGIHTGKACVGNMGSEQRLEYSAIGDTVNIASRLEGLSRAYGVATVVGEETVRQAPGAAYLELDQVRVKGRDAPLRIFTLMGDAALAATKEFKQLAARHGAMIAAYRLQDWRAAAGALAACRALCRPLCRPLAPALDELYALYAQRIADYEEAPPPANWDGVFVATTKQG